MHELQLDWMVWIRLVCNSLCRRAQAAASYSRGRAMVLCVLHGAHGHMLAFQHLSLTAATAANSSHLILPRMTVCMRTLVGLPGSSTKNAYLPALVAVV